MDAPSRATWSAATASALLLSAAGVALPAAAAPPPPVVYDALGDSYASGAGVTPYLDAACARSALAPAPLLDGRKKIALDDFVACGGATTAHIPGQVAAALDADTDLVTVSIGGNDIQWIQALAACILADDATCAGAVGGSEAIITGVLPGLLDSAYTSIETAAPDAHVVVTGYPRFFTPGYGDYVITPEAVVTVAEQQLINDAADLLNATIAQAAAEHGFQFVDVTARFADHGVNSADPWISDLSGAAPFHPTQVGYEAYAAALTSSVSPHSLR